ATLATLVTSEVFADRRRCRLRRATSTGAASSGADSARWFEVHPGLSCVLVACGCRQHLQELDSLAALLAGAVRMFHSEEDPQASAAKRLQPLRTLLPQLAAACGPAELLCAPSILRCGQASEEAALDRALAAYLAKFTCQYGCLLVAGRRAAASQQWRLLSATEQILLGHLALAAADGGSADVPVYIGSLSKTLVFRLAAVTLLPGVCALCVCGGQPTLTDILRHAEAAWTPVSGVLCQALGSVQRSLPDKLNLDPNIDCLCYRDAAANSCIVSAIRPASAPHLLRLIAHSAPQFSEDQAADAVAAPLLARRKMQLGWSLQDCACYAVRGDSCQLYLVVSRSVGQFRPLHSFELEANLSGPLVNGCGLGGFLLAQGPRRGGGAARDGAGHRAFGLVSRPEFPVEAAADVASDGVAATHLALKKTHSALKKTHFALKKTHLALKKTHSALKKIHLALTKTHFALKKTHSGENSVAFLQNQTSQNLHPMQTRLLPDDSPLCRIGARSAAQEDHPLHASLHRTDWQEPSHPDCQADERHRQQEGEPKPQEYEQLLVKHVHRQGALGELMLGTGGLPGEHGATAAPGEQPGGSPISQQGGAETRRLHRQGRQAGLGVEGAELQQAGHQQQLADGVASVEALDGQVGSGQAGPAGRPAVQPEVRLTHAAAQKFLSPAVRHFRCQRLGGGLASRAHQLQQVDAGAAAGHGDLPDDARAVQQRALQAEHQRKPLVVENLAAAVRLVPVRVGGVDEELGGGTLGQSRLTRVDEAQLVGKVVQANVAEHLRLPHMTVVLCMPDDIEAAIWCRGADEQATELLRPTGEEKRALDVSDLRHVTDVTDIFFPTPVFPALHWPAPGAKIPAAPAPRSPREENLAPAGQGRRSRAQPAVALPESPKQLSESVPASMPSNGQHQHQQLQLVPHLMRACCSSSREAGRRLRGAPTVSCESAASTIVPEPPAAAAAAVVRHRNSPSTSSDFPVTASSSSLRLSPDTPAGSSSCQSDYVSPFTQSPLSEVSASWSNGHQQQQQQQQKQQQQRIERALLALCREFEQRLRARFTDFDARLDTRPESAQAFVMQELDSLFGDGCINWGRVVAAFVLARQLCFKCEAEGNPQLATEIQGWVCDYIQDRLWPWIAVNHGWTALLLKYSKASSHFLRLSKELRPDQGVRQGRDGGVCKCCRLKSTAERRVWQGDTPNSNANQAGPAGRELGSRLLQPEKSRWAPLASIIALAAVSIAVVVTVSLMRQEELLGAAKWQLLGMSVNRLPAVRLAGPFHLQLVHSPQVDVIPAQLLLLDAGVPLPLYHELLGVAEEERRVGAPAQGDAVVAALIVGGHSLVDPLSRNRLLLLVHRLQAELQPGRQVLVLPVAVLQRGHSHGVVNVDAVFQHQLDGLFDRAALPQAGQFSLEQVLCKLLLPVVPAARCVQVDGLDERAVDEHGHVVRQVDCRLLGEYVNQVRVHEDVHDKLDDAVLQGLDISIGGFHEKVQEQGDDVVIIVDGSLVRVLLHIVRRVQLVRVADWRDVEKALLQTAVNDGAELRVHGSGGLSDKLADPDRRQHLRDGLALEVQRHSEYVEKQRRWVVRPDPVDDPHGVGVVGGEVRPDGAVGVFTRRGSEAINLEARHSSPLATALPLRRLVQEDQRQRDLVAAAVTPRSATGPVKRVQGSLSCVGHRHRFHAVQEDRLNGRAEEAHFRPSQAVELKVFQSRFSTPGSHQADDWAKRFADLAQLAVQRRLVDDALVVSLESDVVAADGHLEEARLGGRLQLHADPHRVQVGEVGQDAVEQLLAALAIVRADGDELRPRPVSEQAGHRQEEVSQVQAHGRRVQVGAKAEAAAAAAQDGQQSRPVFLASRASGRRQQRRGGVEGEEGLREGGGGGGGIEGEVSGQVDELGGGAIKADSDEAEGGRLGQRAAGGAGGVRGGGHGAAEADEPVGWRRGGVVAWGRWRLGSGQAVHRVSEAGDGQTGRTGQAAREGQPSPLPGQHVQLPQVPHGPQGGAALAGISIIGGLFKTEARAEEGQRPAGVAADGVRAARPRAGRQCLPSHAADLAVQLLRGRPDGQVGIRQAQSVRGSTPVQDEASTPLAAVAQRHGAAGVTPARARGLELGTVGAPLGNLLDREAGRASAVRGGGQPNPPSKILLVGKPPHLVDHGAQQVLQPLGRARLLGLRVLTDRRLLAGQPAPVAGRPQRVDAVAAEPQQQRRMLGQLHRAEAGPVQAELVGASARQRPDRHPGQVAKRLLGQALLHPPARGLGHGLFLLAAVAVAPGEQPGPVMPVAKAGGVRGQHEVVLALGPPLLEFIEYFQVFDSAALGQVKRPVEGVHVQGLDPLPTLGGVRSEDRAQLKLVVTNDGRQQLGLLDQPRLVRHHIVVVNLEREAEALLTMLLSLVPCTCFSDIAPAELLWPEAVHLPRRPAHEGGGVQQLRQPVSNRGEVIRGLDPLDQVVVKAALLHLGCGLLAQLTDHLVAFLERRSWRGHQSGLSHLAIAASLHHGGQDVLGGHKGQLLLEMALDDHRVDHQAVEYAAQGAGNDVGGQERLRDAQAAVAGVVQGALHPLHRMGVQGVLSGRSHDVAGQAADPLQPHGVPLVRHGGGADLVALKRLLDLLPGGQQAQVGGDFVRGGAEAGQLQQDFRVHLAAVGLPGDDVGGGEAGLGRHQLVQPFHPIVVAVEQLQEAGLGAGGAFDAAEAQVGPAAAEVAQVGQEVGQPQTGPLAHSGELGGLQVREAQAGQRAVLAGESRQGGDCGREPGRGSGAAIYATYSGRGAQVDDGGGRGTLGGKGVHVRHDVVLPLPLLLGSQSQVEQVQAGAHLGQLPVSDGQTQLLLRLGQPQPQAAPGGEFFAVAKVGRHLGAGVASHQGGAVNLSLEVLVRLLHFRDSRLQRLF
uniref:BCL domain-containing protein n=2 Tax=Macrostomum lignano TaxID=282301 RepID=A0A1I8GNN2_9PLAT